MAFQERILSLSSRNTALLQSLADNSHAPAATRCSTIYIDQLQTEIAIETKRLEKLHWKVQKERSEYEMYRDAHTKRFAAKLRGKKDEFAAKTAKEEQEYKAALETQAKTKLNLETLQTKLEETKHMLTPLEKASEVYFRAQSELNTIYTTIFALPHAKSAAETSAETALHRAEATQGEIQQQVDLETQTIALLSDALRFLTWAHNNVLNAVSTARFNTLPNYYNALGVNVERQAMNQAQSHAGQADMLLAQVRRLQPLVQPISRIGLTQAGYLSDGERPFNVARLKEKMKVSEAELKRGMEEVEREIGAGRERVGMLEGDGREVLEEARLELQRAREAVFRDIVEGKGVVGGENGGTQVEGQASDGLPSYTP